MMAWLTRNPASAWHAASEDQSNALLQRQLPTKLRITVATVYIQRYNKIHWHPRCPGKAAAGGCPSAPGSGAAHSQCRRQLAVPAPSSQCWWHPPKCTGKPKARVKARKRRLKQAKILKLQVLNSPRYRIDAQSARWGPKQAWKH